MEHKSYTMDTVGYWMDQIAEDPMFKPLQWHKILVFPVSAAGVNTAKRDLEQIEYNLARIHWVAVNRAKNDTDVFILRSFYRQYRGYRVQLQQAIFEVEQFLRAPLFTDDQFNPDKI